MYLQYLLNIWKKNMSQMIIPSLNLYVYRLSQNKLLESQGSLYNSLNYGVPACLNVNK